jgi:hypothetical protein
MDTRRIVFDLGQRLAALEKAVAGLPKGERAQAKRPLDTFATRSSP